MVGEIIEVILPDNVVLDDGFIEIEKAGTITISGLDSYHETTKIGRLSYSKPGTEVEEIKRFKSKNQ